MWHFLITSVSLVVFRGEGKGEYLQGMEGLQLVKVSGLTPGLCRERPVSRLVVGYGLDENDYFHFFIEAVTLCNSKYYSMDRL
jgi:hypothetical protein